MLVYFALTLAFFETLALAGMLWAWADRVTGAKLLLLYLLGVSAWIVGNGLPFWLGDGVLSFSMALLGTGPVTSAVFVNFCAVFCQTPLRRRWLLLAYGLGGLCTLMSWVVSPGHWASFADLGYVAIPNVMGWVCSVVWGGLAAIGVGILLRTLLRVHGVAFQQTAAIALSCGWGLFCMTGYASVVLYLPWYPWPLLGLPLYPLILVYGILRYRVLVVNAWARRALVWAMLLGLGGLIVALVPMLPLESRWLSGMVVAMTCLGLNGPVRRFAEQLVYPGGAVTANDLNAWRMALRGAESSLALAHRASQLMTERVHMAVDVTVDGMGTRRADTPSLRCTGEVSAAGRTWRTQLDGWDAAPPGPRHVADLFCTVLDEAAEQVEYLQHLAQREREHQLQLRLAELGALAATVAHDVRNPLNIIAMAVAFAAPEVKTEVAEQVSRIARLTQDLLDYAKPWQLQRVEFDLVQHCQRIAQRFPRVSLDFGLNSPVSVTWVTADPHRLDQALTNLLTNAQAAGAQTRTVIEFESTDSACLLHVCDDGPGIPAELRDKLFEPFASRSTSGTGLGLVIVARVMHAHGGTVTLTERPPWRTCFTLSIPLNPHLPRP